MKLSAFGILFVKVFNKNITNSNHALTILGYSGDSVDFSNANGWSKNGTSSVTINGSSHTFDHYHNSTDATVLVKVEQAILDTL